jgi:HEAT repeat protein
MAMIEWFLAIERAALWTAWVGVALTLFVALLLAAQRAAWTFDAARRRRLGRRYQPLIRRALAGDQTARHHLVTAPRRHRLFVAELLITPLIDDRSPARIAATRALAHAMMLVPTGDRYLRSRWWWRRALALRALGLLQMTDRTPAIVAALDDENGDVRGAALDALTDLHDPAALPAIVARMHDPSLHPARRAAALAAYGANCEPLVLEFSGVDPEHRLNYAQALALCGTERSRSTLCQWTNDDRVEVRAAAFEALAHVGLDEPAAAIAIRGLDSGDVEVRAMAARALRDYPGSSGAAQHLVRHLDDVWPVAIQAARSLRALADAGQAALQSWAARSDLAGLLARQMLWEEAHS